MNAGEEIFFGGELIDFWVRGIGEDRLCSCFEPASRCEVWASIIDHILRSAPAGQIEAMIRLRSKQNLHRRLSQVGSHWLPEVFGHDEDLMIEMSRILYQGIQIVTGCQVIIDSSKFSYYAGLLARIPELDLSFIQLVRDPRAVAHSWARIKLIPDPADNLFVPQFGIFGSTLRWVARNYSASRLGSRHPGRYYLMKYEDFVADPEMEVNHAWHKCGLTDNMAGFRFGLDRGLPVNHAIWGNPSRFRHGNIAVTSDDAWRHEQPGWQRRLISLLAAPGLARYGYR